MLQAGDATIGGLSIRSEMEAIRGALGVCPQDNVLYDLLTAREHLELFTALRSGGGGGRAAVDSLLARASLAAKARKSCSSVAVNGWSLSSSGGPRGQSEHPRLATLGRGGQRRELCLSCEQRLFTAHTL